MTAYIFFHTKRCDLDKYSDAEIYYNSTSILFKNYDFHLNDEDSEGNDIQWRFYNVQTTDNILFKIKFKDTIIDNTYIIINENGMFNCKGGMKLNICDNMIKIFKFNPYTYMEGDMYLIFECTLLNNKFNGRGIRYNINDNYKIGSIRYEGDFIDNMITGKAISYYSNGNKFEEGEYKNNLFNGEGIRYYMNGNIKSKGYYKDNLIDGEITVYYETGSLQFEGNYKNNKRHGKCTIYYESGSKYKVSYYIDDKITGKNIKYYETGCKMFEVVVERENGISYTKGKLYYECDDNIERIEYDGEFKHNKFNGYGISYYYNGDVEYIGRWEDNIPCNDKDIFPYENSSDSSCNEI